MGNVFVTSDLHFFHNKEFVWQMRGYESVEEMNEIQIEKFNSIVRPEDTCYFCGDVALGPDPQAAADILKQLNGNKILILGNHDSPTKIKKYQEENVFSDYQYAFVAKIAKLPFYFSHYPTLTGNGSSLAAINLFGHTHQIVNNFNDEPWMAHIGVDSRDGFPVNVEDIAKEMKEKIKRLTI